MRQKPRASAIGSAFAAEPIRVPKEYEIAVTMALGSTLQYPLPRPPRTQNTSSKIFAPRTTAGRRCCRWRYSTQRVSRARSGQTSIPPGCIGVANELVDCDDNVRNVMDYLLCRTIIVKDLNAGIALKNRTRGAFHIATLEGDIISTGGSMSGGSLQKNSFNRRELQELREKLKKLMPRWRRRSRSSVRASRMYCAAIFR